MEFTIDTSNMEKEMNKLYKKSSKVFNTVENKILLFGANQIKNKSIEIAKREAVGVTRNYMRGFRFTNIKNDNIGKYIMVYNTQLYSQVIEKGGYWKKQPPVDVIKGELAEWVSKKLMSKSRKRKKERIRHNIDTQKGIKAQKSVKAQKRIKKSYGSDVIRIAYAIGKNLTKNQYDGRGQKFFNSFYNGKLEVMQRAFSKVHASLIRYMNYVVNKALESL